MKSAISLFFALVFGLLVPMENAWSQLAPGQIYQILDRKGKPVAFETLVKEASKQDMVFFGELHNAIIAHQLQLQLLKALDKAKPNQLLLGTEMFETDDQIVFDEIQSGLITERHLETEAKLWPNYKSDYKPLVSYALKNKIKIIASNCPRRYANRVFLKGLQGLDTLSNTAKAFLPPLPITVNLELPGYKSMLAMGMGRKHAPDAPATGIAEAQALKDATMAHAILKYWSAGKTCLHINGAYHTANGEGILWYLSKANPKLKILTIDTKMGVEPGKPFVAEADYTLVLDEDSPVSDK